MGRQVFAHENVEGIARALVMLVHQNSTVDEAMTACGL
jgi:DhnA family fructose-bisphosphate aldolase class Ia